MFLQGVKVFTKNYLRFLAKTYFMNQHFLAPCNPHAWTSDMNGPMEHTPSRSRQPDGMSSLTPLSPFEFVATNQSDKCIFTPRATLLRLCIRFHMTGISGILDISSQFVWGFRHYCIRYNMCAFQFHAKIGLVAQRITRLTTNQEIAGSNPAEVE